MSFSKFLFGAVASLAFTAGAYADNAPKAPYQAGTPLYSFNVDSATLTVDGKTVDRTDQTIFDGYPMLASEVKDLGLVDKAIVTKEQTLELWSPGQTAPSVLLAFDLQKDSANPTLLNSRSGDFKIDSATWAMDNSQPDMVSGVLTINLQECQGSSAIAENPGRDQGKRQPDTKPAPLCKSAVYVLNLKEMAQDQGRGQDKGPNK